MSSELNFCFTLSQVGDPRLTTEISNQMIRDHGHYVQAINFPTVAKGEEKLRIAPTPHHTRPMMDAFATQLSKVWQNVGLPLKPAAHADAHSHKRAHALCPNGQAQEGCEFCSNPGHFSQLEARGIHITSMRNRANRLEEMFVNLVESAA